MSLLNIKNLKAQVGDKPILKGLNLTVNPGEIHAIMGPNGAGKSSLAHILAGREGYTVTSGEVTYQNKDLLELAPEDRARAGLFLGFQYPVEIAGVTNAYFLKSAVNAIRKSRNQDELDAVDFLTLAKAKLKTVDMDPKFLDRSVNHGFSGGEKKTKRDFSDGRFRADARGFRRDRFGARH